MLSSVILMLSLFKESHNPVGGFRAFDVHAATNLAFQACDTLRCNPESPLHNCDSVHVTHAWSQVVAGTRIRIDAIVKPAGTLALDLFQAPGSSEVSLLNASLTSPVGTQTLTHSACPKKFTLNNEAVRPEV